MRGFVFEDWAIRFGGLKAESARSYVSYLTSVEEAHKIDLDRDWVATRLVSTRAQLSNDRLINPNTRRNRLSALSKYESFLMAEASRT